MSSVTDESRVLIAAGRHGLLEDLRRTYSMLEDIQKGLHDYLERKRVFFSRFYFLSNDELLEILSKTKEPERIQPHLRKCFDGINRLVFTKQQEIKAMISAESELVNFRQNIVPAKSKGNVPVRQVPSVFVIFPLNSRNGGTLDGRSSLSDERFPRLLHPPSLERVEGSAGSQLPPKLPRSVHLLRFRTPLDGHCNRTLEQYRRWRAQSQSLAGNNFHFYTKNFITKS